MNEEEMKQLREQMEVRIVALLLGEASAFETAEIEQAIQRDPELAAFHTEMRRTIELTREASKQFQTASAPAAAQPKLSAERREALLAHFKQGKVVEVPIKRLAPPRRRHWLVPASLAAGIALFLSALAMPRYFRARRPLAITLSSASHVEELRLPIGGAPIATLPQRITENAVGQPPENASVTVTFSTPQSAANAMIVPAPPSRPLAAADNFQNSGLVNATKPQPGSAPATAPKLYLPQTQTPPESSAGNKVQESLAHTANPGVPTEPALAKNEQKVIEWGKMDNSPLVINETMFSAETDARNRREQLGEVAGSSSSRPSADNPNARYVGVSMAGTAEQELAARAKKPAIALPPTATTPPPTKEIAANLSTVAGVPIQPVDGEASFHERLEPTPSLRGNIVNLDGAVHDANGPAVIDSTTRAGDMAIVQSESREKSDSKPGEKQFNFNYSKGVVLPLELSKNTLAKNDGTTAGVGPVTARVWNEESYYSDTNRANGRADRDGDGAHAAATVDYSDNVVLGGFGVATGPGGGGGFGGGFGTRDRKDVTMGTNAIAISVAGTMNATARNDWGVTGQPGSGLPMAPVLKDQPVVGDLFRSKGNPLLFHLEGKNENLNTTAGQSTLNRSDISGPATVDLFAVAPSSTPSFDGRLEGRVARGQAATSGSHEESDGFLMLGKAAESVPPTPLTPTVAPWVEKTADPNGSFSGPALLAANPVSEDPKKALKDAEVSYDEIRDTERKPQLGDAVDGLSVGEVAQSKTRFFRLRPQGAAPSQKLAAQLDEIRRKSEEEQARLSRWAKDEPAPSPTPAREPASTALGIVDGVALRHRLEGEKASEDAIAKNSVTIAANEKARPAGTGGVYSFNMVGYTTNAIDAGILQGQREPQTAEALTPPGAINFQDADLSHVIDAYQDLTGTMVVRPNSLPESRISVHSEAPMKRQEAIQLLDTVLAMNGITMLSQGDKAVKAVPQATAPTEAARFQDANHVADEKSRSITKAIQLKNAIPQDVTAMLQPLASTADSIKTIDRSGTIILRDSEENIKRMEELIEKTDVAAVNEYEPLVIPIKNGRASDIAEAFSNVAVGSGSAVNGRSQPLGTGLSSAPGGQNSSAGGIDGYGGGGGVSMAGGFGGRGRAADTGFKSPTAGRSSFQDRSQSMVGTNATVVVLGQAKIIADERSNSLLVFAKKGESETITNIIAKLDVAQLGGKAEIDSKKKAAVVPLGKVVLTGITSLGGSPSALLEITEQEPGRPDATRRPALREGERDGSVEVLSIDAERNLVRIRNGGHETNISFEIPKPAASAPTPQPEINTRQNAFSTFSLNVSDVSFKLAAASLDNSVMPEPASIRVEEFVNAFNYHDPAPAAGARMAFAWERAHYPFAHNRDIVRFAIQTAAHGREAQKPLNLVILLDNSGSMERADRVQIVREALKVLAQKLQPQDRISVVTFARTARLWVDGMAGGKPKEFLDKVLELNPDGGTNLEDALALGYATAAKHFLANGMNRVILLTDGAANLGNVEPEALKQKVVSNRIKGIALDCFGIGWEGYNDDLLEVLSHNGDGRYGFLDHPEEAAPEFANQLAGALNVEAADVKTQVEFNPRRVLTWRQIGYAKHQLTKEQFRDNKVDAAELAASESGNALYAIEVNPEGSGPIGTVRVRYKIPATGQYVEQAWPLPYQPKAPALDESSPAMRLAVTAAAFGEWLARSPYAGEVTPSALQPYLNSVCETYAPDSRPQRLAGMIRQAQAIAGK